jgi:hypothetical protein
MPTYKKITGTTESEFAVQAADPAGNYFRLINASGTASFVEPGSVTNVPVRVLDDAGDNQSAMTRGAITALVGSADSIKWFKVPFAFDGGGPGSYDFTSTATFPTGSIVMGVKVSLDVAYNGGANTLTASCNSATGTDLIASGEVDLEAASGTLFAFDQAVEVSYAATMNIHVRVTQTATPVAGNGNVYVGYVETPIT